MHVRACQHACQSVSACMLERLFFVASCVRVYTRIRSSSKGREAAFIYIYIFQPLLCSQHRKQNATLPLFGVVVTCLHRVGYGESCCLTRGLDGCASTCFSNSLFELVTPASQLALFDYIFLNICRVITN